MSDSIQSQVDSLLFEQGSFSTIAWLLKVGLLDNTDYLNWRQGKEGFLENCFKTTLTEILANLTLAQQYAEKLHLVALYQPTFSIAQKALTICRSQANDSLFNTVYQLADNRVQTDLFFDSAPVLVVQDLIKAIVDRRGNDISVLMAQCRELDPETFTSFECLLAQQDQWHNAATPEIQIAYLLNTMTALAVTLLGRWANEFLTPFWQQLSFDLSGQRFAAEAPENHASFTAMKSLQWQKVVDAIESEVGWNHQPMLLYRYAEACFRLNKEAEGLASWFRLYLLFPESAECLINETDNYLLRSDWRQFTELDPELEPVFFPAWTVLKKPALAKIKVNCIDGENRGYNALHLICGLVMDSNNGINAMTITDRTRLRQQNPSLFSHYMAACR